MVERWANGAGEGTTNRTNSTNQIASGISPPGKPRFPPPMQRPTQRLATPRRKIRTGDRHQFFLNRKSKIGQVLRVMRWGIMRGRITRFGGEFGSLAVVQLREQELENRQNHESYESHESAA